MLCCELAVSCGLWCAVVRCGAVWLVALCCRTCSDVPPALCVLVVSTRLSQCIQAAEAVQKGRECGQQAREPQCGVGVAEKKASQASKQREARGTGWCAVRRWEWVEWREWCVEERKVKVRMRVEKKKKKKSK